MPSFPAVANRAVINGLLLCNIRELKSRDLRPELVSNKFWVQFYLLRTKSAIWKTSFAYKLLQIIVSKLISKHFFCFPAKSNWFIAIFGLELKNEVRLICDSCGILFYHPAFLS